MAKKINAEDFIKGIAPRLVPCSNGKTNWKLIGVREAGHGYAYEKEAKQLVSLCNEYSYSTECKVVCFKPWWEYYPTYWKAVNDDYVNHSMLYINSQASAWLMRIKRGVK